jgi:cell wall-associated NlpC family hydrolase
MTAKQLDVYLRRKGSPLAGQGATFIQAGRRYGVSPALLVAISGAESSFGKISSGAHNPFGWGPGIDFPSWAAGIAAVAKGLRSGYLDQGRKTVASIGSKWAPSAATNDPTNLNSNWVQNVNSFLKELGGGGLATSAPAGQGQPSSPTETSAPDSSPDLSGAALGTLGEIATGKPVMPSESLDALVQSVAASGGPGATQIDSRGTLTPPRRSGPVSPGGGTVLNFAEAQIGQPYVWGGESRKEGGFDCSGLIQAAYAKAGIAIPRTTYDQIKGGRKVGWSQLRPGDLVFANHGEHVVMYVGGGKVIAAPHRGTVVQYQPLSRFKSSFVGARRYL